MSCGTKNRTVSELPFLKGNVFIQTKFIGAGTVKYTGLPCPEDKYQIVFDIINKKQKNKNEIVLDSANKEPDFHGVICPEASSTG
jgi:hypothetical protein